MRGLYYQFNIRCYCCDVKVSASVAEYSFVHFWGYPLCRDCQNIIKEKKTTPDALFLYIMLKSFISSDIILEFYDGKKHIDIAIPEYKIYIEVDGLNHNLDSNQSLSDLMRDYYSYREGFYTIRVSNSLVKENIGFVLEWIEKYLVLRGYKPVCKYI